MSANDNKSVKSNKSSDKNTKKAKPRIAQIDLMQEIETAFKPKFQTKKSLKLQRHDSSQLLNGVESKVRRQL